MKKITLLFSGLIHIFYFSCQTPLEQEQYKKTIYFNGTNRADDKRAYYDVPYLKKDSAYSTFLTVNIGGSLKIEKDVNVEIALASKKLKIYNQKFNDQIVEDAERKAHMLPLVNYTFPSMKTIIKKGETYSRIPFTLKTFGLDPDTLFCIPLSIIKSSDYQKESDTAMQVIFYSLRLYNEYSKDNASYKTQTGSINRTNTITIKITPPKTTTKKASADFNGTSKKLTALSFNKMYFPLYKNSRDTKEAKKESQFDFRKKKCVIIEVTEEKSATHPTTRKKVLVSFFEGNPLKMNSTQKESSYDPQTKTFYLEIEYEKINPQKNGDTIKEKIHITEILERVKEVKN